MELWWNLDILWWNLDRFEHKFDGNITNWPCWSEGKLGTGPFTWLGQGFQTNFSEIPFQKRENLSIYGQNYGQLRSITDFWRSFNRSKIGLIFTPVFCNASRNTWGQQPEWLAWWKSSFGRMKRVWGSELWGWLPMGLTSLLGWALMTETLIKWRRDLLYSHPSHNLCPHLTSCAVLVLVTSIPIF